MTTFVPDITTHPTSKHPVKVTFPGAPRMVHSFQDKDWASGFISGHEASEPYTTRVTTDADHMRRVLAPLVEIAARSSGLPTLSAIRVRTLDDGTLQLAATDRYIILRGKLTAPVLGEPVDVAITDREAGILLDLLGEDRQRVEHCEACAESGALGGCERSDWHPDPVILDIGPESIRARVGKTYRTTVEFDVSETPKFWPGVDEQIDELTHPDNLADAVQFNMIGQGVQPGIVPTCPGLVLYPRATADGKPRWGIFDRKGTSFDGVQMPITEEAAK